MSQWFIPGAFALPPAGTFASTSRNFLSGTGTNNWDISLYKTFTLREQTTLQFRADAFNPFNHTEFSGVGLNRSAPSSFSKVTSAKNARNLMLGLRLQW